jgi:uncharacterized protein YuzE
MNFMYSTAADALYIELEPAKSVARTVEISPRCLVDLDEADKPVGIELIHPARSYVDLTKVVGIWSLDPYLLLFPYQSFPSIRRSVSATGSRVEVEHGGDELKIS